MIHGGHIGNYSILSKIGEGSYGQIFIVRGDATGEYFAAKVEPSFVRHKTVAFEIKVLKALQESKYFPEFVAHGSNMLFSYFVMGLLGPSLSMFVKRLPDRRFSISSGLRIAFHTLKALEFLHHRGYVHRDLKPSNIVIRRDSKDFPVVIIDYGMARYYRDRTTGDHLPARPRPGFRGTVAYASVNAHMKNELSRRDDMISWFYVVADLIMGQLPWSRNVKDILATKQSCDMAEFVSPVCPDLDGVWQHISSLTFEQEPDYGMIARALTGIMDSLEIQMEDPYDWDDIRVGRLTSDPLDGITEQVRSESYEDSLSSRSCCSVA